MFKNYLTIAWRNLLNHKGYALINIVGLACGIAAFVFIYQYVQFELSYDTFQQNNENIYRVRVDRFQDGALEYQNAFTVSALGPAIKNELPEIEDFFRLAYWAKSSTLIYQPDDSENAISYKEENIIFAEAAFVQHFSLNILESNTDALLAQPHQLIIAKSVAEKYFGQNWMNQAVGSILTAYNSTGESAINFEVAGVFQDLPQNSHLKYDIIFSHATLPYFLPEEIPEEQRLSMFDNAWGPNAWYTYLVLNEKADAKEVGRKITEMVAQRNESEITEDIYRLQSIRDIHLYSDLQNEASAGGNANWVYAMGIIACFILSIAWINYINLSTARAITRAREVGLRKMAGARKTQLLAQFLTEITMINIIALVLAVTIIQICTPFFNAMSGLRFSLFAVDQLHLWLIILLTFVLSTLLVGLYPALILSSFQPAKVLKNQSSTHNRGITLRKLLVVFQFAISLILIIGTMVIYQQINFMREQDLGFDSKQKLIIEGANVMDQEMSFQQSVNLLRNALNEHAAIQNVSASSSVPGEAEKMMRMMGRDEDHVKEILDISIDAQYFGSMGIEILEGRNFSEVEAQNQHKIILNQSAVALLNYPSAKEAVGDKLGIYNHWGITTYEIIGVVPDYHQSALQSDYEPLVFFNEIFDGSYVIEIDAGQQASMPNMLSLIQKEWNQILPNNPFNYYFLDQYYNQQYQADQRFGQIFRVFSVLAILIACLGLLGLSSFTSVQRTKEIGIRKVLGASMSSVLALLSAAFIKLIIIAGILALPLSYWLMQKWLESYAFRIDISGWILIVPLCAVLLLALITVSIHTIKTATTNPTNSLRYE